MKSLFLSVPLLVASISYAAEYHVAVSGSDDAAGSKGKPFLTIQKAADVAQPGDMVTVHEGVYRERVNPPRGGLSDDQRIVYRATPGEKVVIKGSERITGWKQVEGDTWKVTLPNSFFGKFNPYNDIIQGEWHKDGGYPRTTGTVYINGTWMDEAETLKHVLPGPDSTSGTELAGGRPRWKAEVGEQSTAIWAQFNGIDPNQELVEINVRQSIFYPDQPGRNYITVRGFEMHQAATPWSGAMSEQVGLIGTHWSKGWVIQDNVISHSMNTGITLGGFEPEAGKPEATAEGYIEYIMIALEKGWSKTTIGSHVVRNNHVSHCEKNGIHGSLGGIFSTIEGNTICDIATEGWISGADVAGVKLLASNDVLIRNNRIFRCGGYGGLWLDWMAQGTRVTRNLFHDNRQHDLFMEVNHGPFLVDNNIFLSADTILEASQGGAYVHNLSAGKIQLRKETRYTPYFKPHTVKEMKSANFTQGDERYYNNLFVGPGSLPNYGENADIEADGNVFLTGLSVRKEEKNDGIWIQIPELPAGTSEEKRSIVTTALLGKAKVPNQAFEQPDGTPYRIDTDYFGKKRSGSNPSPGPFQGSGNEKIHIKVWPKNNFKK